MSKGPPKPINKLTNAEIEHEIVIAQYQVDAAFVHADNAHEHRWQRRLDALLDRRSVLYGERDI